MRLLILGADGLLGHKLCEQLSPLHEVCAATRSENPKILACLRRASSKTRMVGDVCFPDRLALIIYNERPDVVINCIGAVKHRNPTLLTMIEINAALPHRLMEICRHASARLIHIGTDCVFSGCPGTGSRPTGYSEIDRPDPVDGYGYTKMLGEVNQPGCLTIRTSLIGLELKNNLGLIEWFLGQGGSVKGFTRARYSGLTTQAFAGCLNQILSFEPELEGLVHLSSQPITKHDLLVNLAQRIGWEHPIEPDSSVVCDRALDCSRLRRLMPRLHVPVWNTMLDDLAQEILQRKAAS